ncbi:MAG: ribosomal L7Ae/L30e/S12e/Gadd45 family protein [Synergistaceae bacterium]|nr:ribosomal L7Ae/L30e/S12e/Gadd45 family protein [Synergistaceae bacterium]
MGSEADKVLSLLGMARRAGVLMVGQDRVFAAMRDGGPLFIITSADCSPNVLRKALSSNCETLEAGSFSRESLGTAIGVANAQIVALPGGSGFVEKLKELLK